jgi:hypothetical protein
MPEAICPPALCPAGFAAIEIAAKKTKPACAGYNQSPQGDFVYVGAASAAQKR